MLRDVQFDVLDKIRDAGIKGDATLFLSRSDTQRLLDGFQLVRSDLNESEDITNYEGTSDSDGNLVYRLDNNLPKGVGAVEQPGRDRVHISLSNLIS